MYKINHIKATVINILSIIFHVIIGAIFIVNLGLASVMATIDRSQVELNETFTL